MILKPPVSTYTTFQAFWLKSARITLTPYLDDPNCTIYLPTIIIAEVINTLFKQGCEESVIKNFIYESTSSTKFKIINPGPFFYYKNIRKNSQIITLKTHDLIIFSIAKHYKVDKLLAIDKKLSNLHL